jgi:hypothetical protein
VNDFQLACQLFTIVGLSVAVLLMAATSKIMSNPLDKPLPRWVRFVKRAARIKP